MRYRASCRGSLSLRIRHERIIRRDSETASDDDGSDDSDGVGKGKGKGKDGSTTSHPGSPTSATFTSSVTPTQPPPPPPPIDTGVFSTPLEQPQTPPGPPAPSSLVPSSTLALLSTQQTLPITSAIVDIRPPTTIPPITSISTAPASTLETISIRTQTKSNSSLSLSPDVPKSTPSSTASAPTSTSGTTRTGIASATCTTTCLPLDLVQTGPTLNRGQIAGITIGTIAGILLAGATIFLFLRPRRQQQSSGQTTKLGQNEPPGQSLLAPPVLATPSLSPTARLSRWIRQSGFSFTRHELEAPAPATPHRDATPRSDSDTSSILSLPTTFVTNKTNSTFLPPTALRYPGASQPEMPAPIPLPISAPTLADAQHLKPVHFQPHNTSIPPQQLDPQSHLHPLLRTAPHAHAQHHANDAGVGVGLGLSLDQAVDTASAPRRSGSEHEPERGSDMHPEKDPARSTNHTTTNNSKLRPDSEAPGVYWQYLTPPAAVAPSARVSGVRGGYPDSTISYYQADTRGDGERWSRVSGSGEGSTSAGWKGGGGGGGGQVNKSR
ncbi:hypothetical protein VTI74DRAFT_10838 [Chaetomium olivicolor]